jgi:hypothetical protein
MPVIREETMSRPFVIDEKKKRNIVSMVHWGVSITAIADYLGCDRRTIQRLRRDEPEFDEEVRAAGVQAQLKPLDCLRRAASTHWRAAAYLLEREERMQAERHEHKRAGLTQIQLQSLRDEVKQLLTSEVRDPFDRIRFEQKLETIFVEPETKRRPSKSKDLMPSWRKAALALERLTPLVEAARQALDDRPELGEVRYRPEQTERQTERQIERQIEPRLVAPATASASTATTSTPPPFICPTKRGRTPGYVPRDLGSVSPSPFAR